MLQLVRLRPTGQVSANGKDSLVDSFTTPPIFPKSIPDLIENCETYINQIPKHDRYNIFYTVAHCTTNIRDFTHLTSLMFDCDGTDQKQWEKYQDLVSEVLGVNSNDVTVIDSGNGLHFGIELAYSIKKEEIKPLQRHYKEVCRKLDAGLKRLGLPSKGDQLDRHGKPQLGFDMILDSGRILRCPGTENRKPGQPVRLATVKHLSKSLLNLKLPEISGIPLVPEEEAMDRDECTRTYPKPDIPTILEECQFLKWTKDSPLSVREPDGYAALSILAHLQDGGTTAREYMARWTKSSSLSSVDPDRKIEQARTASGPRFCESLQEISGQCVGCKWRGKIKSPIAIVSPEHIRTEGSGFHTVIYEPGRTEPKLIPNQGDLLKAFKRDKNYLYQTEGKQIWAWNNLHYEAWTDDQVKAYAEKMFKPDPKENIRLEFLAKARVNNQVAPPEYQKFFNTEGLLNLKNGVLRLKDRILLPHSSSYGFKYVLPYDYDPTATAPRFERFLDEVSLNRAWVKAVILDLMAATLMPSYDGKAAFWWLQGSGANGKSTLIEIIMAMLGEHNTTSFDAYSLSGDGAKHRLADLESKLLAVFEEVNEKSLDKRLLGTIKNLSAGGKFKCERKYKPSYDARATAKIVMTSNGSPILEDVTTAIKRRMVVVPFDLDLSQGGKETGILKTMLGELPGILNLVLGAGDLIRQRGDFFFPRESAELVAEFIRESDSVEMWAHERLELAPGANENTVEDVYTDYIEYCGGSNHCTKFTFGKRLKEKFKILSKVVKKNGINERQYVGCRLK